MSVRKEIIEKSILEIIKRLSKLNEIIDANPLSDLFEINDELKTLLNENEGIEKRTSKEFIDKINILSEREKIAKKSLEKQKDIVSLIDQKFELESELEELKRELYYLNK